MLGQKVKGQGHRVKKCKRRSSAGVSYALYRVPILKLLQVVSDELCRVIICDVEEDVIGMNAYRVQSIC